MSRRVREGLIDEGCLVLDAGMVATEMLYHLVGSRELDGGAMVTASHNPKAYTGIKLRPRGCAGALRRRRDRRRSRHDRGGTARPARRRKRRGGRRLRRLSPARALLHRPGSRQAAAGRRRRRQRHGRADGGTAPRAHRDRPRDHVLGSRRRVPRPRAEPARGGEPAIHHGQGPRGGRGPRDRMGRRRRPLLLHRRHGRVRRRRLPDRAARPTAPGEGARRDDPLRRARQPRRTGHGARARGDVIREPGRPRLLQGGAARAFGGVRRRGLRPLLLPRLLVRRLGDDPGAAGAGAALGRTAAPRRLVGAFRSRYFISGEINSEVADQDGKMRELADRFSDARSRGWTASPSITPTGTSTSGPPTRSRCCGSTSSRSSPGRTWRQARRGPRA